MTLTSYERVLDFNADCAEFCPQAGHLDLLAAGTYQLNEATQERNGRLYIGQVESRGGSLQLSNEATLDTAAIFDMQWCPCNQEAPTIALACSDGCLSLVQHRVGEQAALRTVAEVNCTGDSLACSVALQGRLNDGATDRICATGSGGEVSLVQVGDAGLSVTATWQGHDLEAWNCCFDFFQRDTVYTGGDDCAFKGWDTRQDTRSPAFVNRKSHQAGVCCMASSPHEEHSLVTGSYDEHVRQWDMRQTKQPVSEVTTGGGLWRLKWHPRNPRHLLAACMHNGFAVLHKGAEELKVVYDYPYQKSLGYGADWCHDPHLPVAATASFYDCLLHIWEINLDVT